MTRIVVNTEGGKTTLFAPYNPECPARARALGGKWSAAKKVWVFDARVEPEVRELAKAIYGTDGSPATAEVVTLRISANGSHMMFDEPSDTAFWAAGRQVAYAFGRDSGARTCEGVIIDEGHFGSAGSMKNPCITRSMNLSIRLMDVPRAAAEAWVAAHPSTASIVKDAAAKTTVDRLIEAVAALSDAELSEFKHRMEAAK